jgi:hypothetical protein
MPEPEVQPATKPQDWEENLSPERTNLKEMADLMAAVLQTVTSVEKPAQTLAGYADELLRRHESELPESAIKEISEKRQKLLDEAILQEGSIRQ